MEIFIHERDEVSYVALEGRLDVVAVEAIEQPFANATTNRGVPTIVDMSGVTFMSSLGIGFLAANAKQLKKAGCKLVLVNPRDMVESVLRTSKMDRFMPIARGLEEALQLLGFEPASCVIDAPKVEVKPRPQTVATVSASGTELKLAIRNDVLELEDVYDQVADFLAAHSTPERSRYIVNLALEELVVNVIRYAYVDLDEHVIDIGLRLADQKFILVIEDDGRPFDPREALSPALSPSLDQEEDEDLDFEIGGLGLMLVFDMVDALKYERVGEKNHVEVHIQFRAEEAG